MSLHNLPFFRSCVNRTTQVNTCQLSERCFKCSKKPVGAWLASDAGDAVFVLNRADTIAGKPAPTGDTR